MLFLMCTRSLTHSLTLAGHHKQLLVYVFIVGEQQRADIHAILLLQRHERRPSDEQLLRTRHHLPWTLYIPRQVNHPLHHLYNYD